MLFFFFVISLTGLVEIALARGCDNGWMPFNKFCYLFSNRKTTFNDAVSSCLNSGATLIEISVKAEEDWMQLQNKIRGYPLAWIGLTDVLKENEYVFASSGFKPSYDNWLPGQPQKNNKGENCAAIDMNHAQWHDYPCGRKMYYVCKKPFER